MDIKDLRPKRFITKIPGYAGNRTVMEYIPATQDKIDENVKRL